MRYYLFNINLVLPGQEIIIEIYPDTIFIMRYFGINFFNMDLVLLRYLFPPPLCQHIPLTEGGAGLEVAVPLVVG